MTYITPAIAQDTRYQDAAPAFKSSWLKWAKHTAACAAIFSREKAQMYSAHAYRALGFYVYATPCWYGVWEQPDTALERWYFYTAWCWLARLILQRYELALIIMVLSADMEDAA